MLGHIVNLIFINIFIVIFVLYRENFIHWDDFLNMFLWLRQKDLMKEKTFGNTVQERQLFHGADPATIETICNQNFDRYICGTGSSAFGLGEFYLWELTY